MMNSNYFFNGNAQNDMGGMPNYYDPSAYGTPMVYGKPMVPTNNNALSAEEMQVLKNDRPASKLDLTIDKTDAIRSMCTHKENGHDVVLPINDGSGDVYCPICKRRWNPNVDLNKEDVEDLVHRLIDLMENTKWVGDLPVEVVRDYYTLIPLIAKFPDLYEYSMNTFNKYFNTRNVFDAQGAGASAMYNSLFGPGQVAAPGYYQQTPQMMVPTQQAPQMNAYAQQMAPGYVQPNQYVPSYMQPTQAMINPATNQNPMQATYGVNPAAPNQQFVSQANTMMNGTVYATPGQVNQVPAQQATQMAYAPVQQDGPTGTPVVQQDAAKADDAKTTKKEKINL